MAFLISKDQARPLLDLGSAGLVPVEPKNLEFVQNLTRMASQQSGPLLPRLKRSQLKVCSIPGIEDHQLWEEQKSHCHTQWGDRNQRTTTLPYVCNSCWISSVDRISAQWIIWQSKPKRCK